MKVRIKFSKKGPVKFVGHLDTMRYFQKALRRSKLPVAFSEGFSPHIIMSFASPLGVGMESEGEYFDLMLKEELSKAQILGALDPEMAEGFRVLGAVKVGEGKASNAMALMGAADYLLDFRGEAPKGWRDCLASFAAEKEIPVVKEGKKGQRIVDIRPFIYEICPRGEGIFVRLASASANYTRPDTVMEAFARSMGLEPSSLPVSICRLECYAGDGQEAPFVSLLELGERI